ncbi:hypothetical protein [Isoptericola sp. QY 916]|uniref:hypothetical protein n=1 Tax=Isoptericola sp. QY 916 TaxID=2782570 RepID=UPI003D2FF32E|nr:hypothetical protein [Isoptericola sp. QY 916]
MAVIQSFQRVPATGRPHLSARVAEFDVAHDPTHGRLMVLRTYAQTRRAGDTPAQVIDLDLKAAQELRVILNRVFDI